MAPTAHKYESCLSVWDELYPDQPSLLYCSCFATSEQNIFNNIKGHSLGDGHHASVSDILHASRFRCRKFINGSKTRNTKHLDEPRIYNSMEQDDTS
ncbi:hypothetical protein ATANTOWER_028517 [Ataeniobius toweri]|uniref:Uncharacterized protein n=1 Tax=Ataeniobius toweri TaxID=208326 RepID=A0ABU7BT13_9TELE|nr:hypothetical protein [Ataeniobius toweri]